MRVGGKSNGSLKNIMRKSCEDFRALQQVKIGALGGFGTLLWKNLSKLTQFM
jgi:glycosyltransferase